jgi:uncharacterized protein (DUF58 family)
VGRLTPELLARPTAEGWVAISLTACLSLAAFGSANNLLYLLVGPLWVAVGVALLHGRAALYEAEVHRELPDVVVAGVEAAGWLVLRAPPTRALGVVHAREPGVTDVGVFAKLRPSKEGRVSVGWRFARRGVVDLDRIELVAVGPFGWAARTRWVASPCAVIVLPRPLGGADGDHGVPELDGDVIGRWSALDGDVAGLREWRDGDPVRGVHWPTSARVGAPVVVVRSGGGVQVVVTIADASGAEWEREISRATGVVLAARARGHGVLVRFPDGSALDGEPDQVLVGLALAEVR